MASFFSSDLHLGHQNANVLCGRPYSSVEEMNEDIIFRHNSVVKPEDMVYYVGDVCLGKLAESLPLLHQLNGTKMLILGNHDRPSMAYHHKKADDRSKWMKTYQEYFPAIFEQIELPLFTEEGVLVSHYPYGDPDFKDHAYEGRFASILPKNEGKWLIHGHVHGALKVKGRQINVGVDAWNGYPVSFDTIQSIINGELAFPLQAYTITK